MPTYATLANIRELYRELARCPNNSQVTDADVDADINTYILYDMPSELRLFSLRSTLTFYTTPFVDTYETSDDPSNPLFDFKNRVIAIHPPVYIGGVPAFFTQFRNVFYGYYPQTNTIRDTLVRGNGTAGAYTGTVISFPILQNSFSLSALDQTGQSLVLTDNPINNTIGALGPANLPQGLPSPYGQINYLTGEFSAQFQDNVKDGSPIFSTAFVYQPSRPISMLYFDNKFVLRSVPNITYPVQIEVDLQPTALMESTDVPQINQWWQLIAYGAAIKKLQRRTDKEAVEFHSIEYQRQLDMVLRTSLIQQANQRTTTIFSENRGNGGFWWFNGPFSN